MKVQWPPDKGFREDYAIWNDKYELLEDVSENEIKIIKIKAIIETYDKLQGCPFDEVCDEEFVLGKIEEILGE